MEKTLPDRVWVRPSYAWAVGWLAAQCAPDAVEYAPASEIARLTAELEAVRAEQDKMHRRAQEAEGRADALQGRLDAAEYRPTNQDMRYWRRAKAAEAERDALAAALRRARDDLDSWGRFGPATHDHGMRRLADDLAAIDAALARLAP
jgi:chromosome segregation ATPase